MTIIRMIGEDNAYTRLINRATQPVPAQEFSGRAGCAEVTARACREFRFAGGAFADSYSEQVKYVGHVDPRGFFISKCVREVLKASLSEIGWCNQILELWQGGRNIDKLVLQATAEAIHNQQHLSVRKLFETLLFCLLFRDTNQPEYFRHLLLLLDLDQYLSRIGDSKEFYEKVSTFYTKQADEIRAEILALESTQPELTAAWYAAQVNPKNRFQTVGKIIASSRSMYKQVVKNADLQLRTTLGCSYEVIFGSSSRWIHFLPSRTHSSGPITLHDVIDYLGQQSLLDQAILYQCMELMNSVPGECCAAIRNTFQVDPDFLRDVAEGLLLREFAVDDYVICTGTLLKVAEVHRSQYDLIICRVVPLDGYLKEQDWLPSSMLTLFHRPQSGDVPSDTEIIAKWTEATGR